MADETSVLRKQKSPDGKLGDERNMISVDDAHSLIEAHCHCLESIKIPLEDSTGFVLAEDIYSPINLPPFAQAAMDGYALRFSDLSKNETLLVEGEIAAGMVWKHPIKNGTAVRIFTGAQVPPDADVVIEQERVDKQADRIYISKEGLSPGANIRKQSSQIAIDDLAMQSGETIGPAAVGFLASMGIRTVSVYKKPEIVIVVSGNELQQAGSDLNAANIYESNSVMLKAALQQCGYAVSKICHVMDDDQEIENVFKKYSGKVDALIFTGGISVGDYDLIRKKLETDSFQKIFYKVKQKPGKPFWFGLSGKTRIFALPGNPAAVLTCFYLYVYTGLRKMSGFSVIDLASEQIPLLHNYSKKGGLSHFLKGYKNSFGVKILEGQESFKLHSFSKANCIVYLPEELCAVSEGEKVKTYLLPGI